MTENQFSWPNRRPEDPAHQRLLAFLVLDIQHSPVWAQELAEKVAAVRAGKLREWERSGNAFCLTLSATSARLEDEFDENSPVYTVSLEEFETAVLAWIKHIQ